MLPDQEVDNLSWLEYFEARKQGDTIDPRVYALAGEEKPSEDTPPAENVPPVQPPVTPPVTPPTKPKK